ncbi:MAG: AAA domain-containing protein, partial [Janthinobacterium lividum]
SLAEQVFAGQSRTRPLKVALPPLAPGRIPNDSQQHAIEHSQASSLTYVWGPPGTGKTSTLGRIVEAYVNRGLRVLVAVHANAAVDEVTEDIAETLTATSFYNQGQILRLGNPQKASLAESYDMVLIDTVVQRLGASLLEEQAALMEDRARMDHQLAEFAVAGKAVVECLALEKQQSELAAMLAAGSHSLGKVQVQLVQKNKEVTELEEKMTTGTAGTLKRLLLGTSLERLRQNWERATFERDALRRQLTEMGQRQEETQRRRTEVQACLSVARRALAQVLRPLSVTEAGLWEREEHLKAETTRIGTRLEDIQKRLDDLPKRVLTEARVVCTTLAKTFAAKKLPDDPFDVLIVDEASMAPMPYLYWALGRCRQFAVIAGDFLQLPPICIAKTPVAQKWLGRSIYQQVGVDTVERAKANPAVCLLDTQYRMHPDIAAAANDLFYGGLLKSHASTGRRNAASSLAQSPLAILDTSEAAPWCSRLSGGGRFNLYHAVLAAHAAQKIVQTSGASVGIISPYAAQARLITKILGDLGLEKAVRAATVHRFQGGEEDVILFDTVESVGLRVAPMLDDTQEGSEAKLLLNVALTRAKSQVMVLANLGYLSRQLSPESSLAHILARFGECGERIESQSLVDSYFTRSFGDLAGRMTASGMAEPMDGSLFTEHNFYSAFKADLQQAEREVILLSPFLSTKRSATVADLLRALVQRGVKVRVFTKPTIEQTGGMALNASVVMDQLRTAGVEVTERPKMHQKAAILDRAVAWEGSLNILSHKDTGEQMRRLPYITAVNELIRVLDLDEVSAVRTKPAAVSPQVFAVDPCPVCSGKLVVRVSEHGAFLSCTDRECAGKRNITPRSRVMVQTVCKVCDSPMLVKSGGTGPFLGCSRYPECKKTLPLR